MRTFDASISARWFWGAAFVPPLLYLGLLQAWSGTEGSLGSQLTGLLVLLGIAQALPIAALVWTLCSVAAYSIGPGQLIVHRVVRDRAYSLREVTMPPAIDHGSVVVRLPGRLLRLHVAHPAACLDALLEAARERRP